MLFILILVHIANLAVTYIVCRAVLRDQTTKDHTTKAAPIKAKRPRKPTNNPEQKVSKEEAKETETLVF